LITHSQYTQYTSTSRRSYEDNIKPTLVQLQEHLNLDAVELKKIVLLKPAVLSYVPANVVTKLRHQ
jgi:hypothetical protein